MKHSQWLHLKAEVDKIVAALKAEGFHCRKHTHRLSWHFRKDTVSYTLAWLPAPVGEWSLLPNSRSPLLGERSKDEAFFSWGLGGRKSNECKRCIE